jgi:hypothetical protein
MKSSDDLPQAFLPSVPGGDISCQNVAGVAHDVANLLGLILNYTTLIARQMTEPVTLADLGEIRVAAQRATGLMRQLSVQAGADTMGGEMIDVDDVVHGAASPTHDASAAHGAPER